MTPSLDGLQQVTHKDTQTKNGYLIVLFQSPTEYLYRRLILRAIRDITKSKILSQDLFADRFLWSYCG